jgi:hypothetical protein
MNRMKLEHRRQKVASLPHFLIRLGTYALFSLILIAFSLGIGISGYHYFGLLNWLDSFQMSCMILTGMGPIAEMTTKSAKIFSSIYALYSGLAFLSITAVFLTPIIHRILHILHLERDIEGSEPGTF